MKNKILFNNYLHFVASFLIVLVLGIPFYTSSAYATISGVAAKGSDGIDGFAKKKDTITFTVQASIDNEQVTKDKISIGKDPGVKFDDCKPSPSNGFECSKKIDSGTWQFTGLMPYTINLLKDDGSQDDSKPGTIIIDDKAPQVKLSIDKAKFSSEESMTVNYEISEFACDDPACAGKCAGIKNIDFYTADKSFKESVPVTATDCTFKSSINIDAKKFKDGKNSIFAKATDKFSQDSAESSVTFTIDASPPNIISDSFAIIAKEIRLTTFSTNKLNVDAVINISADDLDKNSVAADLSALNPSQNYKNIKASCTSVKSDLSVCKWAIELNPGTSGSKTIVINASDTSGNKKSITINKQLALDDKGPVIQSLSTSTVSAQKQSLGRPTGNTITAVFDEASGLSADDVFLYVDNSRIQASRCSKETSWTCLWDNVNFGNSPQLSIKSDTTDILGNPVAEGKTEEVKIDKEIPSLISLNITSIGGATTAIPGIFKVGDKMGVVANLTDESDISAIADFSKFISEATKVVGVCQTTQANKRICTWLTDTINLAASDSIKFNFTDSAGNSLIVSKQLKIFGLENASNPDFWTSTVSCSPKSIDRQLGPLISQRIYCQVSLKPKTSKQASTAFIGPATCSGASIVQSVDTFNTESGSASPVIRVTLKKDDFNIDNASLSCSLSIFSKIDNAITKNPEIENANIPIMFTNLPFGEVGDAVQKKIDDAKESAQGAWKIIGGLNKLVDIAKKICQFISLFYNVVSVIYSVAMTLNIVDEATEKIPFIGLPIKAAAITSTCGETSTRVSAQVSYEKNIHKFCAFVNCYNGRFLLDKAPGMDWVREKSGQIDKKINLGQTGREGQTSGFSRPTSEYMNPQSNLIVAALYIPPCLPGIIYGLDKYRQIQCLYADCLQNAVGKDGLPVTACEDQKNYATCKYVTGELFAVVPWTAWFNNFVGIIKDALSNPFAAAGIGISIGCSFTCTIPAGTARKVAWHSCETLRLFSQIGLVANEVKNLANEGFKIRQDYCTRLNLEDKKSTASNVETTTSKTDTSKPATKK